MSQKGKIKKSIDNNLIFLENQEKNRNIIFAIIMTNSDLEILFYTL